MKRSTIVVVFGFLLLFSSSPPALPHSQPNQTADEPPLVTVRFTITDKSGRVVGDLREEDLQVFDRGQMQTISSFSRDENPIAFGLVIDASASFSGQFQNALIAARQIIESNQNEDQTFITAFAGREDLQIVQELTSDKSAAISSLSAIKITTSQTALIDALYYAAKYAVAHQNSVGRRPSALVVITDGQELASKFRKAELFDLLDKSDVQIFAIGLFRAPNNFTSTGTRRTTSEDFLQELAVETDGRAFIVDSPKKFRRAIDAVVTSLRMPYVIAYRPTKNSDEDRRKVQVKVIASPQHDKWSVITGRISVSRKTR